MVSFDSVGPNKESLDPLYVAVDVPFSFAAVPLHFLVKKPQQVDMAKLNEGLARFRFSPAVSQGDFLSTSPIATMTESNDIAIDKGMLPSSFAELPAALATVDSLPLKILLMPPKYLRDTYRDLLPRLPDQMGCNIDGNYH